jgi:hypothetical protein
VAGTVLINPIVVSSELGAVGDIHGFFVVGPAEDGDSGGLVVFEENGSLFPVGLVSKVCRVRRSQHAATEPAYFALHLSEILARLQTEFFVP